jgi:hypothetical protein
MLRGWDAFAESHDARTERTAVPPHDEPPDLHSKRLANPSVPRPEASKKDYDRLVKAAWKAGWWCERRGNYIYCYPPGIDACVLVKSSPKKQGTYNLTRDKFRKLGLDV